MKLPKREGAWDFSEEIKSGERGKSESAKATKEPKAGVVRAEADETDEFDTPIKPVESSDFDEFLKKAPKKRSKPKVKEPVSDPDDPELYIDFEDLDIDPPYVDAFKEEFGVYPILSISKFCKLPLRYNVGGGKKRYKMQTCEKGQELKVTGIETGKRVDYNIVCSYRGDDLVIEPTMITKFCKIVNPYHSSFKSKLSSSESGEVSVSRKMKREKKDPTAAKEFLEKVEQRKKEAKFSI